MQRHADKLQSKAMKCEVLKDHGNGLFRIKSPSGKDYLVDVEHERCSCDWHKYHPGKACCHLIRARYEWEKLYTRRTVRVWSTEEDAKRQHRSRFVLGGMEATFRNTI
jgi:hypothetical protein